jgi:hypothetical protein
MEQVKSLQFVKLAGVPLDQDHCRALAAHSRPDLEIELFSCSLMSAGTSAVLSEALGRNQGPTALSYCDVDYEVLADGLRGNCRLKTLVRVETSIDNRGHRDNNNRRDLLALADALRENQGLVELNLNCSVVSKDSLIAICESLKTHPTLEVLDFGSIGPVEHPAEPVVMSRLRVLLDMVKANTLIHTIRLWELYESNGFFRESIVPYLERNRLRPRVCAIQEALPHSFRARVLGRALLAARSDANRFWMLLSGNAEVAFPSRSGTATVFAITPAATTVNATTTAAFASDVATASSSASAAASASATAAASATSAGAAADAASAASAAAASATIASAAANAASAAAASAAATSAAASAAVDLLKAELNRRV